VATAGVNLAEHLSVSSFRARLSKPVTGVTAVTASRVNDVRTGNSSRRQRAACGWSGDERSTAAERCTLAREREKAHPGEMIPHLVSRRMNNPKNEGPELIEPAPVTLIGAMPAA
jgi:hypothetical protein